MSGAYNSDFNSDYDVDSTAGLSGGETFRWDWRNEDGIVDDVTYTPATESGYDLPYTMPHIVTTPVRIEEPRDSNGKYRRWVTSVQLPIDYIAAPPKPRDKIDWGFMLPGDDTKTYSFSIAKITDVPYLGSPYFAEVVHLDFIPELADTVSILQPTGAASSTGARVVSFTTLAGGIRAAIQPRNQQLTNELGAVLMPEICDIYLDTDPSPINHPTIVHAGALIQDQDGTQYDIQEVSQREWLDEKLHIVARKLL